MQYILYNVCVFVCVCIIWVLYLMALISVYLTAVFTELA